MEAEQFNAQIAADPNLPPQMMAQIAQERPDLWVALAGNPALYPQLRQWLAGTGNPQVNAVLDRNFAPARPLVGSAQGTQPPVQSPQAAQLQVQGAQPVQSQSAWGDQPETPAAGPYQGGSVPPASWTGPAQSVGMPVGPPAPPVRKRSWWKNPIIIVPIVLALVLSMGGVAWGAYVVLAKRGASSPQSLQSSLLSAIESKNLLGVAKLLAPSEVDYVSQINTIFTKAFPDEKEVSLPDLTSSDYANVLDEIKIKLNDVNTSIDKKNDHLQILRFDSGSIEITWDAQKLKSVLKENLKSNKADEQAIKAIDNNDILDRGRYLISFNQKERGQFGNSISLRGAALVLVQESGSWFISPAMTVMEVAVKESNRNNEAQVNYDANWWESSEKAANPQQAVKDFLDAINSGDFNKINGNMVMSARRLAMVYADASFWEDSTGSSTEFELGKPIEHDGLTTVALNSVIVDGKEPTVEGGYKDGCVYQKKQFTYSYLDDTVSSVCFKDYFSNFKNMGIAVVKENGYWKVDPTLTFVNLITLKPHEQYEDRANRRYANQSLAGNPGLLRMAAIITALEAMWKDGFDY